jgi:phosphatidylserine/phosphatidylglycerophosphate/cardiolipin synthase-like enzyme/membrane protein DedA with SNARE-associated domain
LHEGLSISSGQSDRDSPVTIFEPGHNCWRRVQAYKVALLIDCNNYYRALHYAFSHAKYSIFILGWDIDSRIKLLRDIKTEGGVGSVTLFDVIYQKATENPDLKIYLNKWDYSLFFAKEREPFCAMKWHLRTPKNVYFCADHKTPFGASHHQKVIVVDDEIAFCGGMDIALGRWDRRQHHLSVPQREDPGGIFKPLGKNRYGPYHDIQAMVTGPAACSLAELVRERWKKCAGFEPVPLREMVTKETKLWPEDVQPDFKCVYIAIARTLPKTKTSQTIREIETMYLSEISRAEKFIYIENQYLSSQKIARALNRRMREAPELRVLIISSDKPRGFMEHKVMWSGRILFCGIAGENINDGRFCVVYPVSKEGSRQETIHIHSKVMIVDDRFLHVGSSNLNNRSMGFDTECDLVIEGRDENTCLKISSIRNNLIREHTGREEKNIEDMINGGAPLGTLLEYQKRSRQHLLKVDDSAYKNERLDWLAREVGDPVEAYILTNLRVKHLLGSLLVFSIMTLVLFSWWQPDVSDILSRESILNNINSVRDSNFSILWIGVIYLVGGAVFFPITVLNLTTAVVFGPAYGFFLALFGSLVSAAFAFAVGQLIGEKALFMFRGTFEKIRQYVRRGGVLGMTLIRFVPIAPYTLVNLAFGLARVPFPSYMLATLLGMLPGIFSKSAFGGALRQLWQNPEPRVIVYTFLILVLWFVILWTTHRLFIHYKKKMEL